MSDKVLGYDIIICQIRLDMCKVLVHINLNDDAGGNNCGMEKFNTNGKWIKTDWLSILF